ncbi:hypothetical protein KIPB_008374 [Kipferlia bialata]|uniref:Uncharacterized protein n=1 Tax=Kipferlia bialata TaxID=797122 RepID=A0A9K3GJT4_9EUKA|nr:hypothetical protein KIPB_008374 [Kipferlia bialata]|eukprot:g8374.t1
MYQCHSSHQEQQALIIKLDKHLARPLAGVDDKGTLYVNQLAALGAVLSSGQSINEIQEASNALVSHTLPETQLATHEASDQSWHKARKDKERERERERDRARLGGTREWGPEGHYRKGKTTEHTLDTSADKTRLQTMERRERDRAKSSDLLRLLWKAEGVLDEDTAHLDEIAETTEMMSPDVVASLSLSAQQAVAECGQAEKELNAVLVEYQAKAANLAARMEILKELKRERERESRDPIDCESEDVSHLSAMD